MTCIDYSTLVKSKLAKSNHCHFIQLYICISFFFTLNAITFVATCVILIIVFAHHDSIEHTKSFIRYRLRDYYFMTRVKIRGIWGSVGDPLGKPLVRLPLLVLVAFVCTAHLKVKLIIDIVP